MKDAIKTLRDDSYIKFTGYDPFLINNFTDDQIRLLKDACTKQAFKFDATGILCQKPKDQPKIIYFYVLNLSTPLHKSLRITEMITNDQAMPNTI